MRKLRQNKVTAKAIALLKKKCTEVIEGKNNLTIQLAFDLKANEIEGISISGRTLRKIFSGERIHINSITNTMKEVGIEYIIRNGKIDIEDEEEKNDNSKAI